MMIPRYMFPRKIILKTGMCSLYYFPQIFRSIDSSSVKGFPKTVDVAQAQSEDATIDDLMDLVKQIVAFHMKHNAEPAAVDLLMEVEDLDLLLEHVDKTNYGRTCLYHTSSARGIDL